MAVSMKAGAIVSSIRTQKPATSLPMSSSCAPSRFGSLRHRGMTRNARLQQFTTEATSGNDIDFDKVLSDLADKFEASENKAAIVAYSAAAFGALWVSEWLIHLPLLNFLLGFPIQLLGLLLLPYFGVKYLVDKDSLTSDAGDALDKVVKRLPGLEK